MPLVLFPFVLTGLSDALVALGRMTSYLTAEDLPKSYDIKDDLNGIAVNAHGDFTWETVGKPGDDKKKGAGKKDKQPSKATEKAAEAGVKEGAEEEKPFQLKNLKLTVPKGAFIGIVGRVGSGKVRSVL